MPGAVLPCRGGSVRPAQLTGKSEFPRLFERALGLMHLLRLMQITLHFGNVWLRGDATDARHIRHNRPVAQLRHELLIAFAADYGRVW
jgi:hypothetical protein